MSYQEDRLTEIADAIRAKDGTTELIKATDFAARILALPSGGDDELLNAIISRSSYTKDLVIPDSVTRIGDYVFYHGSDFRGGLTIPNSVTSIGDYAFYYCNGFTGSLIIPNSVTSIGNYVFYGCNGFTGSLTIPNSVTNIGNYVFYGCNGFTGSLTIPNSVTNIGGSAFRDCSGFTGSLIIPNSITSIGAYAFSGCSGFTGAVFEGQAPTLDNRVFGSCTSILEYDFTNCTTVPTLSSKYAFQLMNANCRILVPAALEAAWKAATNWVIYADYIVGV